MKSDGVALCRSGAGSCAADQIGSGRSKNSRDSTASEAGPVRWPGEGLGPGQGGTWSRMPHNPG